MSVQGEKIGAYQSARVGEVYIAEEGNKGEKREGEIVEEKTDGEESQVVAYEEKQSTHQQVDETGCVTHLKSNIRDDVIIIIKKTGFLRNEW